MWHNFFEILSSEMFIVPYYLRILLFLLFHLTIGVSSVLATKLLLLIFFHKMFLKFSTSAAILLEIPPRIFLECFPPHVFFFFYFSLRLSPGAFPEIPLRVPSGFFRKLPKKIILVGFTIMTLARIPL